MAGGKGNRFPDNLVKKPDDTRTNEEQLLNAPYGQQGAVVFCTENVPVKGDFYCLMAIRDDVILDGENTYVNWDEMNDLSGPPPTYNPGTSGVMWEENIPLPVGLPFYGDFKQIQLVDQGPAGNNIQAHCPMCPKVIAYYK
jgi:hypothetical protein